jgi:hypothetical protein
MTNALRKTEMKKNVRSYRGYRLLSIWKVHRIAYRAERKINGTCRRSKQGRRLTEQADNTECRVEGGEMQVLQRIYDDQVSGASRADNYYQKS